MHLLAKIAALIFLMLPAASLAAEMRGVTATEKAEPNQWTQSLWSTCRWAS
jgi:hypothetical protein